MKNTPALSCGKDSYSEDPHQEKEPCIYCGHSGNLSSADLSTHTEGTERMIKSEFIDKCVDIFACNRKCAELYVSRNEKDDYTDEDVLQAHYLSNTADKYHGKWHGIKNGRTTKYFSSVLSDETEGVK